MTRRVSRAGRPLVATDPRAWLVTGAHALYRPRGSRYGMPCVVGERVGREYASIILDTGHITVVLAGDLYPNPLQLAPRGPEVA